MTKYLVVMAESSKCGRGARGRILAQFLRLYAGHRAVACCTPQDLERGPTRRAAYVFVGLPSGITARHLERLSWRHLVPFDLHDEEQPAWSDANREVLRREGCLYLKAWTDERWDYGLPVGLAPVRRYAKLRLALDFDRVRRWLRGAGPAHRFDVLFLGGATGRDRALRDPAEVPNQRIHWLRELHEHGGHLTRWGGLLPRTVTPDLERRYGDLSRFTMKGKVPFHRYFWALQASRVALTPEGNAPWSYRHYEAIYARSMLVTCDFRRRDTLVPLPRDGMVHVEDGQPVVPAIERALALRRERPELLEENVRFLERWLDRGTYSRRRPALFERFLAQLPA